MLFALLFACLAGLTSASGLTLAAFEAEATNVSLPQFVQFLAGEEAQWYRNDVIYIVCKRGLDTTFLAAAFLTYQVTPDLRAILLKGIARYNRVDFSTFFAERGMEMFSDGTLLHEGASAGQRGVVAFCSELGADFNGMYRHEPLCFLENMLVQKHHEALYHLIEEGAEIDRPDQLGKIINHLGSNLREEPLLQRNYELAYSLLERTDHLCHFAVMVSFGTSLANRMLIERLLEYPQVRQYLQLAKYATRVLLSRHGEWLGKHFGEKTDKEGEIAQRPRKMHYRIRCQLRDQFSSLVREAGQSPALLQPLAARDLQLILAAESDFCLKVYVFMLGLPVDPEQLF